MKLSWLLSLPKSIWFNFRYLPFRQAIYLPIAISYKSKCHVIRGNILFDTNRLHPFMIHYGFHDVPIIENSMSMLIVKGKLIFKGKAHIGKASRVVVEKCGELVVGNNFAISASSYIYCYKRIVFGDNIQLSWNDLIMDSDSHSIYDINGSRINEDKEIVLGNNIWVGCDCKILKGAVIPDNCVVGANSVVTNSSITPNTLVIGTPAKSVKKISGWKL